MPIPQRLPLIDADDGQWGDVLNQFLAKEHFNDSTDNPANGGHQHVTITAGTTTKAPLTLTSGSLLSTPVAGSIEFDSDKLYFTQSTGTTRKVIAAYDDSSGLEGDLYYRDSSGYLQRLGVGSSSQVLGVSSGVPAWTDVVFATPTTGTGLYNVTDNNTVVMCDASSGVIIVTLPAASTSAGYRIYIKRTDSVLANNVSVITAEYPTGTIDGQAYSDLYEQYMSLTVVCDGSNWFIV